ncbi:MAG TPA: acyl--CoA ligase [Blastocatellia bacterium]|nr:acyl--CoA ligase [Blastocatellia bacterium]
MIVRDLLEQGSPSATALAVVGGPSVTYEALRSQVDALTAQLHRFGIRRGDRVAIALPNGLEMIASFLAAATAGTAAPLNPAYKAEEVRFYLEDTGAHALIVSRTGAEEAKSAAGDRVLIIEAVADASGQAQFVANGKRDSSGSTAPPDPDDIALVLHTSGTTSRPKRVPLSHANLTASVRNIAQTYRLTEGDVSLCVMPLFHVHGLMASMLATLYTGGTVVIAPRFNPLSFWATVRDYGASWYSAVPTIHQALLSRARSGERPRGAENLRFIRSCSAALPAQMMAEMEDRFGAPVLEAYGMTEAAHQMASNPLPPGARKPGSVGRGTGVSIAILDKRGGILPPNQRGEVAIKGDNVFGGYEENAEANAAAFTNGWFRTGDQGFLDTDGYLTLTGRIKELINRGGEKISPREIDEALLAHPAVAEAVCFGMPDRVYGEEVAAAVVLRGPATEKELIAHCKSLLADFKCPKAVWIVDSLPRTASGKVQRRAVAAEILNR